MISVEKGAGRTLLDAAIKEPRQSGIAILMHEGLPSEAVPSVLILKKPKGGACQAMGKGLEKMQGECMLLYTH